MELFVLRSAVASSGLGFQKLVEGFLLGHMGCFGATPAQAGLPVDANTHGMAFRAFVEYLEACMDARRLDLYSPQRVLHAKPLHDGIVNCLHPLVAELADHVVLWFRQ